jgi:hypothetical protein
VKLASLPTDNGIRSEHFNFIEPLISSPAAFDYARGGVSHGAVTFPVQSLCEGMVKEVKRKIGEAITPVTCERQG